MIKNMLTLTLLGTLVAGSSLAAHRSSTTNAMKRTASQAAPAFTATDVAGRPVSLTALRGRKLLLSFFRNAGCPICNLRFHELQEQAAYFREKNLVVIAVYESSAAHLQQYLEGMPTDFTMIPDPGQALYRLYGVDKSLLKVMKGFCHGAMGRMKRGSRLFHQKMRQEGSAGRIGADFLIDEQGIIRRAHYGRYVGDHLPLTDIRRFLE